MEIRVITVVRRGFSKITLNVEGRVRTQAKIKKGLRSFHVSQSRIR